MVNKVRSNTSTTVLQVLSYSISVITLLALFLAAPTPAAPIAEGATKFLGNITPSQTGGGIPSNFDAYWNQITPENSGKWGSIERTRDVMSWESLDMAYNYARDKGFIFKQHTFVWGTQEPSWIGSLSPDQQREEVEEWIKAYGERYPETDLIDVVNEPINKPASYREALGGAGETGWDWIIWSFEKARQYCPDAKLLINEFDVENNPTLLEYYLQIINLLLDRKLIDGIGIQGHCFSVQATAPEIILDHLDQLAATGLPLYISELDLFGNDTEQLTNYSGYFPFFWNHPAIAGITIWGWQYNRTWIADTHLLNSTGGERPALTWLREYVTTHTGATGNHTKQSPLLPAGSSATIHPVHNNGTLQIDLDRPGTVIVQVVNMQGRTLMRRTVHSLAAGNHTLQLATTSRTAGTAVAIITINGKTSVQKVILGTSHPQQ